MLPKAIAYPSSDTLFYFEKKVLEGLDFTGFPEKYSYALLDRLIPKDPKYGQLDSPLSYPESGAKVRRWRCISKGNQKHLMEIENPPAPVSRGTSSRATRWKHHREALAYIDYNGTAQLDRVTSRSASSPLAERPQK